MIFQYFTVFHLFFVRVVFLLNLVYHLFVLLPQCGIIIPRKQVVSLQVEQG